MMICIGSTGILGPYLSLVAWDGKERPEVRPEIFDRGKREEGHIFAAKDSLGSNFSYLGVRIQRLF